MTSLGSLFSFDVSVGYSVSQGAGKTASMIQLDFGEHSWSTEMLIEQFPKGSTGFTEISARENTPYAINVVHEKEEKPAIFVIESGSNASPRTLNRKMMSGYQREQNYTYIER